MSPSGIDEQARRLLKEVPLIDGHNDFPYMIRGWFRNDINGQNTHLYDMPIGQTDLQRLQKGLLGGQFWSAYVPCSKNPDPEVGSLEALRQTLQQIDVIHRLIERHPTILQFADSAASIWSSFRAGRVASLIGIEGLHQTADSVSALRMLYRLGVRYVTLTHNCHNSFADAATVSPEIHGGLSSKGERLIRELNRMGMMIDLSHTSHKAQTQALRLSRAPVIYSHSSILCTHPRNVTDENLHLLQRNGGVIMICFLRELLASDAHQAALSHVIDHIIYTGSRIGYEHVGIGSDFDGMLRGPDGLHDVSCYPALVAGLLERGVSEEDVKRVMGLNVIRVMEDVERVAAELQGAGEECLCDELDEVWNEDIKGQLTRERERVRKLVPQE
ncbi:dipeptidase gliJ [Aspergillus novofumigatus IBT 16806]|uniref:Dipeptidase n=1 Tax=Aspergillus novofumigatus (strain IBT 16806) TaxID=1392255 RepID=A0A2I1CCP0_ASPN1|nr:membrane dipeptidase GliJ [Aspergillus novofumigatus IBT 16806]PKX95389.1 membrane dipeptidase GliJ [Aspergillus novofumigatus IBT 16806]